LVLGTLLLGNRAHSQNYKPMLDERAEWHLTWCDQSCKTEVYYTDGDTLENGQVYKVLSGFHYISRAFWLREDIQEQKVWLSLIIDSKRQEFLLYDFSLGVGDSVAMYNPISPFPQNGGIYKVDSIVPRLLMDGQYYRFYYFSATASVQSPQQPVWVEGLGSLSLINAPGGTPTLQNHGQISCYFKLSGQLYENLDTISDCTVRYLSSSSEALDKDTRVQPRITNGEFSLWLINLNSRTYEYSIWDSLGRKLSSSTFTSSDSSYEVPLDNMENGYYLIQLRDIEENQVYQLPFLMFK